MANLVLNIAANVARAGLTALAATRLRSAFAPDVGGPRLESLRIQSSTEGTGLPIVYGRARVAGQVIWATRYREAATSESAAGGKGGGPNLTQYSYSLSFAVALCDGAIDGLGRVWADGRVLNLADLNHRIYLGTEDQVADSLIEAVEGAGDAPAFRGTAYVVFEDFPLEPFGNRLPQLNFEVFRSQPARDDAPRLETALKGVTLIPGSGEFAYATSVVRRDLGPGAEAFENVNNGRGVADITAALDDLQTHLPNVESVLVVVSWFGDDLRVGQCTVRPCVETLDKETRPLSWRVNGVSRGGAGVVSAIDGRPAYGGTPSDDAVLEAIAAIKARGLKVGLYPFILMDVPAGNGLPDPYGSAEQPAFPWRGRITCDPAPGVVGTADKTAAATGQIAAFVGACGPSDFSTTGGAVAYGGPNEWSLRRMVLHYAHLAAVAGGVDRFLIGSELRGVTTVRDDTGAYPGVEALRLLANDVRSVVGPATALSYAADWSEYFGHQPADGSGDLAFHLDPLWADQAIDFVGIDWYVPLSDWRDGGDHLDASVSQTGRDHAYLMSQVEGGEGYTWYYASDGDRAAQNRVTITDGAGKPWVFRYKDLRGWWSNAHFDRPGGVESAQPTAWVPESKPIVFVETGCPAIDKGANQPNVFVDAKSSESLTPHFSSGARDDLIQRRYLEALLRYWDPLSGNNPSSSVYAGPMVDIGAAHAWTWDARPFPDFPARQDVWSDGNNWRLGHWLSGRVGLADLGEVAADLAARAGVAGLQTDSVDGLLAGYVLDRPLSARQALEPLSHVFRFDVVGRAQTLALSSVDAPVVAEIGLDDIAWLDTEGRMERRRVDGGDVPASARFAFYNDARDYQAANVTARLASGDDQRVIHVAAPLLFDRDGAEEIARTWLVDAAAGAESVRLALAPSQLALEAGDVVSAPELGPSAYVIDSITDGVVREAELRRLSDLKSRLAGPEPGVVGGVAGPAVRPDGAVMDLPLLPGESERAGPRVAASASPWPGSVSVASGVNAGSLRERVVLGQSAVMGALTADLAPGPIGRWDYANTVHVRISSALASADPDDVLTGANVIAIEGGHGEWEVAQFTSATLAAQDTYALTGLLRGQAGSELGMAAPGATIGAGARVVVFNGASLVAPLDAHERGSSLTWRFAPRGRENLVDETYSLSQSYLGRHLRPLSPVHLRARRLADGVELSWVRRTRVEGDDWAAEEVPLGEESERYCAEVLVNGAVAWQSEVAAPVAVLPSADEAALFAGAPVASLDVRVAQISRAFGKGAPQRAILSVS